jgi:putative transposase
MRKPYKTDLTDAQWGLIQSLVPPARPKPGCEPTDLREIINTIVYQTKSGVPWDLLPHDLAPRSTTNDYYVRWQKDGTWQRLVDALREKVRVAEGRPASPSACVADSQSVPTTAVGGEERGYDGGKKVKGRKRHILVDTLGLLLAVVVTAANVSDGRAAPALMDRVPRCEYARLRKIYADSRYNDTKFQAWLRAHPGYDLEIVSRPPGVKRFVVLKKRWVVERTFAWLATYRRLNRDYEKTVESSEARVRIAALHLMLKRLTKKPPLQTPVESIVSHEIPKAA